MARIFRKLDLGDRPEFRVVAEPPGFEPVHRVAIDEDWSAFTREGRIRTGRKSR